MVTHSLPLKQCSGKCVMGEWVMGECVMGEWVMGECGCGLARIENEALVIAVSCTELSLPVKTQN